jgi:predicted ArsR family transcriptional regulator
MAPGAAAGDTPSAGRAIHDDHSATRTRVVRSLVEDGPATAAALAERLGLTPGAVRRHLDALLDEALISAGDRPPYGPSAPRRRGRPARVYAVTDKGRAAGGPSDDDLAAEVLRFLRRTQGDDGVIGFAQDRLRDQQDLYAKALDPIPLQERPKALAELLTAEGFAASVDAVPGSAIGVQICQHHCPVAHVAAEFPELCDAEARMFSEVLGTHVQRLATLAHGDGVCTTHLPGAPPQTQNPSRPDPQPDAERSTTVHDRSIR